MFTRILAATDFSALGNAAALRAADLCRRHRAEVTCVHALPSEATLRSMFRELPDTTIERFHAATREQVDDLSRRLEEAAGRPVAVECIRGTPHRAIVDAAEDFGADLVVAGAHGQGVLQQVFLGGTISRLMAGVPGPLLIVRRAGNEPYARVAAAVDLGDRSPKVLDAAVALSGGTVTALHVAQAPTLGRLRMAGVPQDTLDRVAHQFERDREADLAALVGRHPASARLQGRLLTGYPNTALLEALDTTRADLLAIGRHAGGRLAERVLGSVPKFLAYHAPCDLLLV